MLKDINVALEIFALRRGLQECEERPAWCFIDSNLDFLDWQARIQVDLLLIDERLDVIVHGTVLCVCGYSGFLVNFRVSQVVEAFTAAVRG